MAEPAIQFGTSSQFGTQTGWVAQNPTISVPKDRANVLDHVGNESTSKLHNERTECTQEFAAASASVAPTIPTTIGKKYGDYVVTSIAITTSASDFVKMTLTGHKHTVNDHADDLRQSSHGITLSKAFGALDFFGGTGGADAEVESSSITISCQHDDKLDEDGDHLVGENFDARVSGSVVWHGVPATASGASWDKTSTETSEENTSFLKTTVTAEKALSMA